jgi:hypothetical protein
MRNVSRLLMLLALAVLGGCGSEKSQPSELDAPFDQSSLPLPGTTQAPFVSPTPLPGPTATLIPNPAPRATFTPYPTRDRSNDATPELLDNDIPPGDWQYQTFTDEAGITHTLDQLVGRAVMVQTLAMNCVVCLEQQQNLLAAIQDRYDLGLLSDTVFLALDVETREPPSLLRTVLQREAGDRKATIDLLLREDVPADWMVGAASSGLLAALQRAFGPDVSSPEALAVIVIEPDGLAHLTSGGIVSTSMFINLITFYSNPPVLPEQ